MNGAKLLLECLKKQGVDTVFGYPGGAVIPLYDALYDYNCFTHVRTAHEQGAVHAADGYARSTGKVGVCFVTSGPGATNTITGLATAYMDSAPLVIITGQVPTTMLGKDSFQEVDITGITFSVTKHNYLVRDIKKIPEIVEKAFRIAKSGRPGPVLIDIPKDIFLRQYSENELNENDTNEAEEKKLLKDFTYDENFNRAVELINSSKKPVIYAGGGVKRCNAVEEFIALAKKADIPVVNTLMGLGSIKRNDELSLGLVGMHGSHESNLAVTNCDLLLAIGARFSDRVIGDANKFARFANIIHIDVDSSEVDKNIDTNISLIGDVKEILNLLTNKINKKSNRHWRNGIQEWRVKDKNLKSFTPKNILHAFNTRMGHETIVVTDVGQHQMWTAQNWMFMKENQFITSGGLGTMGFGLGAAIGAKFGNPDKPVILVTGDGSFRMNCNELFTVKKYNVPIVILMMNNSALGMVRQWQRMFCEARYSETCIENDIDYKNLVQAFGINSYSVNTIENLENILDKLELTNNLVFIECKIDKNESVYPIVPPGVSIDNILMEG